MKCKHKNGPVVLVSKDISFTFPLSYAYLAGYLRAKGEDVKILFRNNDNKNLVKKILALNPLLVGFGSLYPELKEIRYIIQLLNKAGPQFPIVVGGQMVTPIPEFAVNITGADIGVIGEGEIILHELVESLRNDQNISKIKGLVIKGEKGIINTGPGNYIKNLSQLPPIPYDLFPKEKWLNIGRFYAGNVPQPHWRYNDRVISVHGGRGCPFKCNFCYHHSKPRYRPVDLMLAEGMEALDRFNANMLYFSDDLVLASPKRAKQLVEAIGSFNTPIEYSVSSRFDILSKIDDSLLSDMKKTGCRVIGLGIESGSNRILDIVGKNCTAEQILYELERLKKVGILATGNIMIGQHTETKKDVERSIKLMKKSIQTDQNLQYAFSITTPFPGSSLYEYIFKNGYLKTHKEFYDKYFSNKTDWRQVINLSKMKDDEVTEMYKKIRREYKKAKIINLGILIYIIILLQKSLNLANRICNKELFTKSKKLYSTAKVINLTHEHLLQKLDKFRLRLHGIKE